MNGIELIKAERERQISVEGFTPESDDQYSQNELAAAAACYANYAAVFGGAERTLYQNSTPPRNWPWDPKWWKPKSPERDLVRAGALIAAETDRRNRAIARRISDALESSN